MVGRQAIGIDTFDRSTRVRHPDPVRFSECFYGATVRCRTREEKRESKRGGGGVRKSIRWGLGLRGNRGEHSRETMQGRLATVISENVS